MSMREQWRSVSTKSGAPFAVDHGSTSGELQMGELCVNNWDTNNLASLYELCNLG